MPTEKMPLDRMRLDKWLWAARFFKTRSLATAAVDGGRVRLGGVQVKPAREVKPGDEIEIALGDVRYIEKVLNLVRGFKNGVDDAVENAQYYEDHQEHRDVQDICARAEILRSL